VITFDPDSLRARLADLEQAMGEPGFWDDQQGAARISADHARLSRRLERYKRLGTDARDLGELRDHVRDLTLRRAVEDDPHRAVLVVLGDQDHGAGEVRIDQRRRGDQQLAAQRVIQHASHSCAAGPDAPARSPSPANLKPMIRDVDEASFPAQVVERSREVPVVVDFWAEWCAPCRTLGPALEEAVRARDGRVELAKVDVDSNQSLAMSFGIRGIPAVKAFRDGKVADEFTGAVPPAQIEAFLDRLVPSPADELTESGDEESLRRALEIDPRHAGAAGKLGRLLLARGAHEEALAMLERFQGDFVAEGLAARARLLATAANGAEAEAELGSAFAAWDAGDLERALEALQAAIAAEGDAERRDLLRRVMVAIFTELGPGHPLSREHRRRLAAVLN
jgi:putative thioredoxin